MDRESEALVAAGYDAVYAAVPRAPTLWQIWREHVVGADFPTDFSHISFATLGEVRTLADELRLGNDDVLVDLGCGMGGPCLWIASTHDALRVIGIDASPVAVASATSRADRLGFGARSEFRVATLASTGLPGGAADALLSLDALQYAPNKAAAFREAARVVKHGQQLAFTAFEVSPDRASGLPVLGDDPVDDYRPLIDGAGFDVDAYDETPGWNERVTSAFGAVLANAAVLESEMGHDAYAAFSMEATLTLDTQPYRRHVRVIATRR